MSTTGSNVAVAHCPVCGAEYRSGFERCADDDAALEPGPAPEAGADEPRADAWEAATNRVWNAPKRPASKHQVPVELCQLGRADAHLVLGILEAEGIEADVQDALTEYGFGNAAFPSRVFVNGEQLEDARAIYREFNERQGYETR